MSRKLGILILVLLAAATPLVASTPDSAVKAEPDPAAPLLCPLPESGETSPEAAIFPVQDQDHGRVAASCIPYGHLCDPRYVVDPVCCPGTHCTYLYPNVPKYCL